MARTETKWERRDAKRKKKDRMVIDGRSIFTIVRKQVERSEDAKREGEDS